MKLEHDKLLSTSAFNFNLHRYTEGSFLSTHLCSNVGVSELEMSPMAPFGRGGTHAIAERALSYRAPTAFSFPGLAPTCVVMETQRYVTPRAGAGGGGGGHNPPEVGHIR